MHTFSISYEQPGNELTRVCLRLYHLFEKVDYFLEGGHYLDSYEAIRHLIEIIVVLDRPDLKSKLSQECMRISVNLKRHLESPEVDQIKLRRILHNIEHIQNLLQKTPGKLGQSLRDNEFLDNVRQQILTPGGGCDFDAPALHFWLMQEQQYRIQDLQQWLEALAGIRFLVTILHRLILDSENSHIITAFGGFYQDSLDTPLPCQLIRVYLPENPTVYPEISFGKHRISIRFFNHSITQHRSQTEDNIIFKLGICCL